MAETKKDERTFNKRLIDAMAEMENPTKSKQAYKYKYETLEQVLGIVRPALMNNGLMLFQSVKWDERFNGFKLETGVFGESESRIMDERPFHTCDDAQAEGSWETYMRRYALRTAFGLTGEDDDGAATKGAGNQNPTAKRNTASQNDVFKGAKVTEMASDALMDRVDAKIAELAELRGVSPEKVEESLMKSKAMKDAKDYSDLTKDQANTALCQLIAWAEKANSEMLADDDFEF